MKATVEKIRHQVRRAAALPSASAASSSDAPPAGAPLEPPRAEAPPLRAVPWPAGRAMRQVEAKVLLPLCARPAKTCPRRNGGRSRLHLGYGNIRSHGTHQLVSRTGRRCHGCCCRLGTIIRATPAHTAPGISMTFRCSRLDHGRLVRVLDSRARLLIDQRGRAMSSKKISSDCLCCVVSRCCRCCG